MSQEVIFVGAGHTNLTVLKNWKKRLPKNVSWTLFAPSRYHYYSGMFSGYIEGRYTLQDIRIDVKEFCKKNGGRFIQEKVTSIDHQRNLILTQSGKSYKADVAAVNIGSAPANDFIPGVKEHALFIKPNLHFTSTAEKLRETEYPVIVGGGHSGVEIAFALQEWRQKHHKKTPVALVCAGSVLAEDKPEVQEKIRALLDERGILLYEHKSVQRVDESIVYAEELKLPYGELLWVTGSSAPPLFQFGNLPTDRNGYMEVTDTLHSLGNPSIYGSGDCVTINGLEELPKNGVYAVKEAEVLEENLIRTLKGKSKLKSFKPQKRYMAILNVGGKQGLLLRGNKYSLNKWAWRLKNKIDKRFIRQFP
ncbi:NAD(P)/FAD-dependent oxidoreductase [Alteribacillus sp. HJP-4]|uniref:NAD(P)/FAD-dependent oxidoreductase n=1 Tax=Alteribacillus sp. HJP-4 TaxID=2775394 RepID=UPI0035CCEC9C